MVVIQTPAGGEHQGVLGVGHLGRRGPVHGIEHAQAAGELAFTMQEARTGMLFVGAGPLQAVALDTAVLDADQGRG